jgi:uncharacterized protein YbbK (DUF523 family)
MKKIAISACLVGNNCRYNAEIKKDADLIALLKEEKLIPFCPEDFCYGTPRPSMDLVETKQGIKAISNLTSANLSEPIIAYAKSFFHMNPDIDLFIGKDRSPSCGVCSAKLYNTNKDLISNSEAGLMAKEAKIRGIKSMDAEVFVASYKGILE